MDSFEVSEVLAEFSDIVCRGTFQGNAVTVKIVTIVSSCENVVLCTIIKGPSIDAMSKFTDVFVTLSI